MIETQIEVQTDDGPMAAFVRRPDGEGPFPVVVFCHDGPGLRAEIYQAARELADQGFYVVVPDLYHRYGDVIQFEMAQVMTPDTEQSKLFWHIIETIKPADMADDCVAAVVSAQQDPAAAPGSAGVIGLCHTARTVIHALADHGDVFGAGAMMHPANTAVEGPDSPHLLVERIQRPLYAGIGEVDIIVPLEQQQPLIAELEKIDVAEVDILPTANHGYPLPGSVSYDPPSAERSWAKITALFKRELAR